MTADRMGDVRVRVFVNDVDMGAFPPQAIPALKNYFRDLGMARKVRTVLEIKEIAGTVAEDSAAEGPAAETWIQCAGEITTREEHAYNVLGPKQASHTVEPLPYSARLRAELMEMLSAPEPQPVEKAEGIKKEIQEFLNTGKMSPRLAEVAAALLQKRRK